MYRNAAAVIFLARAIFLRPTSDIISLPIPIENCKNVFLSNCRRFPRRGARRFFSVQIFEIECAFHSEKERERKLVLYYFRVYIKIAFREQLLCTDRKSCSEYIVKRFSYIAVRYHDAIKRIIDVDRKTLALGGEISAGVPLACPYFKLNSANTCSFHSAGNKILVLSSPPPFSLSLYFSQEKFDTPNGQLHYITFMTATRNLIIILRHSVLFYDNIAKRRVITVYMVGNILRSRQMVTPMPSTMHTLQPAYKHAPARCIKRYKISLSYSLLQITVRE